MQKQMQAKDRLMDFLRQTSTTQNHVYTFILDGNAHNARKYINTMRVELSRIRRLLRAGGYIPKRFMMKIESITETRSKNSEVKTEIKLRYRMSDTASAIEGNCGELLYTLAIANANIIEAPETSE